MDRFEAMSMLVTVTETGSLSAAARALKVPLATLSRKVTDLEALLGTSQEPHKPVIHLLRGVSAALVKHVH